MYRNLTLSLLLLLAFNLSKLSAQCVDDLSIEVEQTSHTIFFEAIFESNDEDVQLTYFWDLGDGTTSTIASPVHTYDIVGEYEACVTVTTTIDGVSCEVESCEMVIIEFSLPCDVTAAFEWIDAGFGEVIVQELCETNSFTTVTGIEWVTSEGIEDTGAQASLNFEDLTSTEVCLTVQGISQGNVCSSELCKTVVLEAPELNVTPSFVVKENDGCDFRFINTTNTEDLVDLSFEWECTSQEIESVFQPLVQFEENGTHDVCLVASIPWYGEIRTFTSCEEVVSNCAEEPQIDVQVANSFETADSVSETVKKNLEITSQGAYIKASNFLIDVEVVNYRIFDMRGSLLQEGQVNGGEFIPFNGVNNQLILLELSGKSFHVAQKIQLLN